MSEDCVVRGGVEPPTFRFSGVGGAQVVGITAAWMVAHVRLWARLLADVAVTQPRARAAAVRWSACSAPAAPRRVGRDRPHARRERDLTVPSYASTTRSGSTQRSSSRSQLAMRTARAAVNLTWQSLSVSVRWRPPLATVMVPHLVTRSSRLGARLVARPQIRHLP